MDVMTVKAITDRLFRTSAAPILPGDRRLDKVVFALVDTNRDGKVDRVEVSKALQQDKVLLAGDRLVVKGRIDTLATPRPPVTTNEDYGLDGRPWMRDALVTGGDADKAPKAIRIIGAGGKPDGNQANAGLSDGQVIGLRGKGFGDVAARLKTPADVALFLERNIKYDNGRLPLNQPQSGLSSDEILARGSGVCRDQHALARDILIANGYQAEMLGYSAYDQSHAITAYRDPQTGNWGILEYGTVYPPDKLKARSAVEALMMVRPTTLAISHWENNGPNNRSSVDGIIYTPAARVYERFMAGPSPNAGNSVTAGTGGVMATADLSKDHSWQAAIQVVNDDRFPYMKGAVMMGVWKTFSDAGIRVGAGGGYIPNNYSLNIGTNDKSPFKSAFAFVAAEEEHRDFLAWKNIGGGGINVGVSSHAQFQAMLPFNLNGEGQGFDSAAASGLATLKWNPDVTVDRKFRLWGPAEKGPDTRVFASYGVGIDASMLIARYSTGGGGFPINQYVTGGIETKPLSWLGVAVQGYVPITNHTNDFAAEPLGRVELRTPYLSVGTTQGANTARYDVSTGVNIGPVAIGAYVGLEQDRVGKQSGLIGGIQLSHHF